MTRKDYVLIAEAIRAARPEPMGPDARVDRRADDAINDCASALADALSRDNPRFDRARFLEACGVAS